MDQRLIDVVTHMQNISESYSCQPRHHNPPPEVPWVSCCAAYLYVPIRIRSCGIGIVHEPGHMVSSMVLELGCLAPVPLKLAPPIARELQRVGTPTSGWSVYAAPVPVWYSVFAMPVLLGCPRLLLFSAEHCPDAHSQGASFPARHPGDAPPPPLLLLLLFRFRNRDKFLWLTWP